MAAQRGNSVGDGTGMAILALLAAVSCAGLAGEVAAAGRGAEPLRVAQLEAASISSDQAAAIVRSATGGRVLDVALGNGVYMVRVLLPDGRVRTVRVDAITGDIR